MAKCETKVLAFCSSPRRGGNTEQAMQIVIGELAARGIATELIFIGAERFRPCIACQQCWSKKNMRCAFDDDPINEFAQKMQEADGLLLGSPVYFGNVNGQMKTFMDRFGYINKANGGELLRHKVAASAIAVRRGGATFAYSAMNLFFGLAEMTVATSTYWNFTKALAPGDIQNDAEGLDTFHTLGGNMARLLLQNRYA